tara:strand:- start:1250 stop:1525 length:276 start_codon:yes stop_codon:yes gene_type:complete
MLMFRQNNVLGGKYTEKLFFSIGLVETSSRLTLRGSVCFLMPVAGGFTKPSDIFLYKFFFFSFDHMKINACMEINASTSILTGQVAGRESL